MEHSCMRHTLKWVTGTRNSQEWVFLGLPFLFGAGGRGGWGGKGGKGGYPSSIALTVMIFFCSFRRKFFCGAGKERWGGLGEGAYKNK